VKIQGTEVIDTLCGTTNKIIHEEGEENESENVICF